MLISRRFSPAYQRGLNRRCPSRVRSSPAPVRGLQYEGDMGVIDQLSNDEKKIWHTYLCRARKLTRLSVSTLESPIELKPLETDNNLICCAESMPANFYESINSIIYSIFTAEFRINLAARKVAIYDKTLTEFIDKDDSKRPFSKKHKKFKELPHYLKWRNFPSICARPETKEYVDSIKKLEHWIAKRNDVVHAKYSELSGSNITPQDALDCYESVVDSIFELNIILGFDRQSEEESKREVSLVP